MKIRQQILSLATVLAVLFSGVSLRAEEDSNFVLSPMECQSQTPQIQTPLRYLQDQTVKIGRHRFDEVAYLYNKYIADYGDVLSSQDYAAEVTCKVPEGFSKFNLAFGLDRRSDESDDQDIVLLEVYGDNKLLAQKYIRRKAEMQSLSLDIQNAKTLTLKAGCVNPVWWNNCPRLSFTRMTLE